MDCDETPIPGETPVPYARRVARAKLDAALALPETAGHRVLAADTIVWVEGEAQPLGKPRDPADCARMLQAIGTPNGHCVTTAWALGRGPDVEVHTETTRVWFRPLTEAERDAYLQTAAWQDKAGGYGIQAEAAGWVTRLEGSYTNVVGLPVAQVLARLLELDR